MSKLIGVFIVVSLAALIKLIMLHMYHKPAKRLSYKGLLEIASYEGIINSPHKDSEGVWTIGIGHTDNDKGLKPSKMSPKTELKTETSWKIFTNDMKEYEQRVRKYIKVPLTQHQFDALVSFDYNTGGISHSTLTKCINNHEPTKVIKKAFMQWTANEELKGRRIKEMNLFLYGKYTNKGNILLQLTDGRGKIINKGAKNIVVGKL